VNFIQISKMPVWKKVCLRIKHFLMISIKKMLFIVFFLLLGDLVRLGPNDGFVVHVAAAAIGPSRQNPVNFHRRTRGNRGGNGSQPRTSKVQVIKTG
jgi:hypothetical protein